MTQLETVKWLLRHQKHVTSMDAFKHGITRLAEYIRILRNDYQWNIDTNPQPNVNKPGTHAKYILVRES